MMPHVNSPANSAYVLACGGTTLHTAGDRILSEVAWNNLGQVASATGGGVSTMIDLPIYQTWAGVPSRAGARRLGRGMPDVSATADPLTGYTLMLGQKLLPNMGGTSCVAPLWAGLIARINQALGKNCGFLNPWLYALANSGSFRHICGGSNGAYEAKPGWNACTGLGSPVGQRLLDCLRASSPRPVFQPTCGPARLAAQYAAQAAQHAASARQALGSDSKVESND